MSFLYGIDSLDNTEKIFLLDEPKINISKFHQSYDVSQYKDYNFIAISFDAWGFYFDYPQIQDTRILPFILIEEREIVISQMYDSQIANSEGLKISKSGNYINISYSGSEGASGFWWIYLLKL